jgi:hypothetical protein
MRHHGEVGALQPLTTYKKFFDEGPSPHNMDAQTYIFLMLRNKSKTSPSVGLSVDVEPVV